jgi:hypothetical protein
MRRPVQAALVVLALVVCACGPDAVGSPVPITSPSGTAEPSGPRPSPTLAPEPSTATRDERWRAAIADVIPGLERRHPDPWHSTAKADMQRAVAELSAAVPSLDDDHVLAGLLRIVALVSANNGRDSHTGLYPWGEGGYPLTSLPLRLWVFPDGVHVVEALAPFEDLVGARVTAIGGQPIDDVVATLEPLIPRDNPTTVTLLLPRFLIIPEILRGAGVLGDPTAVRLSIEGDGGDVRDVEVDAIPMAEYNAWAGAYGLHLPDDPDVRYLSRATEPLWFEDLDSRTVYVQYNRVDGVDSAVLAALRQRLGEGRVTDVVVDVRHNYGGEVRELAAILSALDSAPDDARRWLLTGRNTYSAGSMFTARYTAAHGVTVVGEAMGGSPNLWGNSRPEELGDTGLELDVATLFEVSVTPDDDRVTIDPDVPVELTFEDWAAGRDPVLDAALAAGR